MNDLTPPIAGKIGKLIRLLSSERDGEVVATVHALIRTLQANKLDIHTLAKRIENGGGGFDDDRARRQFTHGFNDGFNDGFSEGFSAGMRTATANRPRPEANGPQQGGGARWWVKMARACQRQADRLSEKERDFIKNMVWRTFEPSEKQAQWLRGIFNKLGGE